MSDAELAREWLDERPLVNEVPYVTAESLTALLASVRLGEARFFYSELNGELLPFWLVDKFAKHIAALEQAAGGEK